METNEPDLIKSLCRWNATYWAMKNGICAALGGDARWVVLTALYTYLPNVYPGKGAIEKMTGLSPASVKRARKGLKLAGLIDFDESNVGGSRQSTTAYDITDIRDAALAAGIVKRIRSATELIMNSVHSEPPTGFILSRDGGHCEPPTGLVMNPEVHNLSTQGSTQDKDASRAAAAAPPRAEGSALLGGATTGTTSQPDAGQGGIAALAERPTAQRVTTTGKGRAARTGVKAKPVGLTDDQKRAVCSSTLAMMGYWAYGPDAVGKQMAEWARLAPATTHWAPSSRDLRKPEPDIGVPALSAWVWVQLCRARVKANVPIQLPHFGKLLGTVKSVRGRMTQDDLVGRVEVVTANWGQITTALSWMSSPPQLDELTLTSRHVLDLAQRLAGGQTIQKSAPAVSSETEKLIQERYAKLF